MGGQSRDQIHNLLPYKKRNKLGLAGEGGGGGVISISLWKSLHSLKYLIQDHLCDKKIILALQAWKKKKKILT